MRTITGTRTPWSSDKKYKRLERFRQSLWLRLESSTSGHLQPYLVMLLPATLDIQYPELQAALIAGTFG